MCWLCHSMVEADSVPCVKLCKFVHGGCGRDGSGASEWLADDYECSNCERCIGVTVEQEEGLCDKLEMVRVCILGR